MTTRDITNRTLWTEDRIRGLGTLTDLPTAASIFGLSRTLAYELARTSQFPVPVIRAGKRYRVPVAPILAALHLASPPTPNATTDARGEADLTVPDNGAWITTTQSEGPTPSTRAHRNHRQGAP
jgi:hypothetical protein